MWSEFQGPRNFALLYSWKAFTTTGVEHGSEGEKGAVRTLTAKAEATTIIHSMAESIRLAPNASVALDIELIGEFADFLSLGVS